MEIILKKVSLLEIESVEINPSKSDTNLKSGRPSRRKKNNKINSNSIERINLFAL